MTSLLYIIALQIIEGVATKKTLVDPADSFVLMLPAWETKKTYITIM